MAMKNRGFRTYKQAEMTAANPWLPSSRYYYYIHRYDSDFESDAAIALFNGKKRANFLAMKTRYAENLLANNIKIDNNTMKALNNALNREEIMNRLDKAVYDVFAEQIQKGTTNSYGDVAEKSVENFMKYNKSKASLSALFNQISLASNIFENEGFKNALVVLFGSRDASGNKIGGSYNGDLDDLSRDIQAQIVKYNGENRIVSVEKNTFNALMNSLKNLVKELKNPDTSLETLKKYVRELFPSEIGQVAVEKGINRGASEIANKLVESLNSIPGVKVISKEGKIFETSTNKKTSVKNYNFDNIDMNVKETENGVEVDLGVAAKWTERFSVDSNAAMTLKEGEFTSTLNEIFKNTIEKYYAYNAIGLKQQNSGLYNALMNSMLSSHLDMMFDKYFKNNNSVQYFAVNNQFYSVWQIINALEQFYSVDNNFTSRYGHPVRVSIEGINKVPRLTQEAAGKKPNWWKAYQRAKAQNTILNNTHLRGYIHPNRFKNIL